MKKLFTLFLLFYFLFTGNVFATHYIGGFIYYEHNYSTTYVGVIVTYTRASSPASSPELELFWGDGTSDTLLTTSPLGGSSELVAPDVIRNIYVGVHQYASHGHYILYAESPNRNAGIINIPNSINIPFHIETELITGDFNTENNSATYSGIPVFELMTDSFSYNLGFYDIDGDILTYELVTPKEHDGTDIPGYSIPDGVSINHLTGQLNWNAPTQIGEFTFAVKVTECRNGDVVGTLIFDMMHTVNNLTGNLVQFQNLTAWNIDNNGNYFYILQPSQNFQLQVTVENVDSVSAFGEPFIPQNYATFTNITSATDKLFSWQPTTAVARCAPFEVIFRGYGEVEKDIPVLLYVRDLNMEYCDTICDAVLSSVLSVEENKYFTLYPNPANSQVFIQSSEKIKSISIYDIVGRQIDNTIWKKENSTVDVSGLEKGIYVFVINNSVSRKVVVD